MNTIRKIYLGKANFIMFDQTEHAIKFVRPLGRITVVPMLVTSNTEQLNGPEIKNSFLVNMNYLF